MGDTQIVPAPRPIKKYIANGPRCFDVYIDPEDNKVYVELNVEDSNKVRSAMKHPRKPISDREICDISDYLKTNGNPFASLEGAEECLERGFRILEKIDL